MVRKKVKQLQFIVPVMHPRLFEREILLRKSMSKAYVLSADRPVINYQA